MKKISVIFLTAVIVLGCLCGCRETPQADIAATTLPVYEFTAALCHGTSLSVTRLVTEEVSCLHDYSLNVSQVKAAEAAKLIVISGAGLEDFLNDLLIGKKIIDASENIEPICPEEASAGHNHDNEDAHSREDGHGHTHDRDPHIWLSPENAIVMAQNICRELSAYYPEHCQVFNKNLAALTEKLEALQLYGNEQLASLSCREMITFHDGFAYFAQAFGLTILEAVEEESGSEASAKELIYLIEETEHHNLPAIFIEKNGSPSAASVISRETGVRVLELDMAMSGSSWFDAMYHNIDTVKEALG